MMEILKSRLFMYSYQNRSAEAVFLGLDFLVSPDLYQPFSVRQSDIRPPWRDEIT